MPWIGPCWCHCSFLSAGDCLPAQMAHGSHSMCQCFHLWEKNNGYYEKSLCQYVHSRYNSREQYHDDHVGQYLLFFSIVRCAVCPRLFFPSYKGSMLSCFPFLHIQELSQSCLIHWASSMLLFWYGVERVADSQGFLILGLSPQMPFVVWCFRGWREARTLFFRAFCSPCFR